MSFAYKPIPLVVEPEEMRVVYNITPASEAKLTAKEAGMTGIGVDQSMLVGICTDKIIQNCGLQPVTSAVMFQSGYVPAPGGLFDPDIFGRTPDERKKIYAYIDLHAKFFHPYVYWVLKNLSKAFDEIASGTVCGHITEAGTLVTIKNREDPNYNEDNTGIPWLVENFHSIKWKETSAMGNQDRNRLIRDLSDDEIFISKYLVVPIFYRDKEDVNGRVSVPDVNKDYNRLIQYSIGLSDTLFASFNNALYYKMQKTLCAIQERGQGLIQGKNGHYHKAILGKNIDLTGRDVISVNVMNEVQHPRDNPVDMYHTGTPLAKCIVLAYPFMSRYCLNFFEDNFKNQEKIMVYKQGDYGYPVPVGVNEIKNHLLIYTKNYIDKRMERFKKSYGERFDTIKVYFKDGSVGEFCYTGFMQPESEAKAHGCTIIKRPMTWTDLFYLAAMETCTDKHMWVTRYPLTSFSGTFPTLCVPVSTVKTMKAYIDGKVYERYPLIDLSLSKDDVSTKFIDVLMMSNLFLDAIGGDFNSIKPSESLQR